MVIDLLAQPSSDAVQQVHKDPVILSDDDMHVAPADTLVPAHDLNDVSNWAIVVYSLP